MAFAAILFWEENYMATIENVMEYYKSYDEEGRLLLRYGLVEYLTTMKYIKKYLKKDARLLAIGSGTGS